ncbi:ATP-dependent DNA helicase [Schizosaccharomyces cryophilus OY26]|uniref:DNA 3'-5' helicase n=1 Tax=Schizosaccharomyces cryophilus (strain OY26 / ATCC MYA-4695 / CBS 11777 / NBRC 106824 / NRRL Y48691) TaxID=653667 RepID=S9W0F6_SCHCR|nr:ATP-dependent DNA helicase [Schizosaccharomyces cryophilus OY26]EPY51550.1 ATP-dependent DNA helicase [Schizosaccharomyces cryophilus OY26]
MASAPSYLQSLNTQQRLSVESAHKYTQILAGPGSGKTRVLTSRVAYLLQVANCNPRDLIVATFTNKAANEIKQRIHTLLGNEKSSKIISGTFHSIAYKYLSVYGKHIGLAPKWLVADRSDAKAIVKRLLATLKKAENSLASGIRGQELTPENVLTRISKMKSSGLLAKANSPELILLRGMDAPPPELQSYQSTELYKLYQTTLRKNNLMDFDDLLLHFILLLQTYPSCIANIKHILIDEFQDTSRIQYYLLKLLAQKDTAITIVGDPDQSIYGFRSAEIENLNRMTKDFKGTQVLNLEMNYRSAYSILELAFSIISQDKARPQKGLKSDFFMSLMPSYREFETNQKESYWTACEIKRIVECCPRLFTYDDFAILVRSSSLTRSLEHALTELGVSYRMVGVHKFFDREEVRDVVAYAKVIANRDPTSLIRIINTPTRNIGKTKVDRLLEESERRNLPLWQILVKVSENNILLSQRQDKSFLKSVKNFIDLIERLDRESHDKQKSVSDLISSVLREIKYYDFLRKKNPETYDEKWDNVMELVQQSDVLAEQEEVGLLEEGPQETSLQKFLGHVTLASNDKEEEKSSKVTISTLHAAKGLEWPVVFLPCVCENIIPHSRSEDVDEERRLLYVGVTRAQALLYISSFKNSVGSYNDNENFSSKQDISSFLRSYETRKYLSERDIIFNNQLASEISIILNRKEYGTVQNVSIQEISDRPNKTYQDEKSSTEKPAFVCSRSLAEKELQKRARDQEFMEVPDEPLNKENTLKRKGNFDIREFFSKKEDPQLTSDVGKTRFLHQQGKQTLLTDGSNNKLHGISVKDIGNRKIPRRTVSNEKSSMFTKASSLSSPNVSERPMCSLHNEGTEQSRNIETSEMESPNGSTSKNPLQSSQGPRKKRLGVRLRASRML